MKKVIRTLTAAATKWGFRGPIIQFRKYLLFSNITVTHQKEFQQVIVRFLGWPASFLSHNRGVGPILTIIITLQGTVSDHKQHNSGHRLSAVLFSRSSVPLFKNANSLTFVYFY